MVLIMSLFGSSGIRGVVGSGFTLDMAADIGNSLGCMYGEIIHGRDPRISGKMFMDALAAGELAAGADAYDAGMIPTPTLARAVKSFGCGVMITASHNPPEYNGVKLWNTDGSAFDTAQMQEVEELLSKGQQSVEWHSTGRSFSFENAAADHVNSICNSLTAADSKAVLDCGCGATCAVSPEVLRTLGCRLTTVNAQPDGFFPGRSSEPAEEQLHALRSLVVSENADLGIAHDGDGDRMVALDEKGNFISGDRLIALFASWLHPASIAVPVDASMAINDLVKCVHRCKVGDVFIAEALKKYDADFGGEPSGTYIFPKESYCPDGIFAGALLASIASEVKLSEYLGDIPVYPVYRNSSFFENKDRNNVADILKQEMESIDCDSLSSVDGYRADFSDGWLLIRLSGTEPKLRVTAEAVDEQTLNKLQNTADNIMKRCLI